MGNLLTNLNNVTFSGDFGRPDLKRLLAALHNVKRGGFHSVNLNLGPLTKAFTPEVLPLAVYCRGLLHDGFEVLLELPTDDKLRRLFENSNWAYLIDPRSHASSNFDSIQHLPAILYCNADEQYAAVEKVVDISLRNLNLTDRHQLASIEWSINEIADNVLNHAHSPVGGALQVSARPERNLIEYVVCDAGLGIPKTLRESHPQIATDLEALDRAIREGVTRNRATNMGNGLYGSYLSLLAEVFAEAKRLSRRYATIYVRTHASEFTLASTVQVLQELWPNHVVSYFFNRAAGLTQTALFLEEWNSAGEVDLLLTSPHVRTPEHFSRMPSARRLRTVGT